MRGALVIELSVANVSSIDFYILQLFEKQIWREDSGIASNFYFVILLLVQLIQSELRTSVAIFTVSVVPEDSD